MLSDPAERHRLIRAGWQDAGKLFMMALVLDAAYQMFEFRWIYPLEAMVIAVLLAAVPYVLLRGITTRILRQRAVIPRVN
jgi:hypothetical protein